MTIEKQLKELQRLKEKGVITEEEYHQARRNVVAAEGEAKRATGVVGGMFKWGAIGCLSVIGGGILLFLLAIVLIAVVIGGASADLKDGHGTFVDGSVAVAETAGDAKVQVTMNKVTDPAISTKQSEQPSPGHHYLTVAVTIQNVAESETSAGRATLRTFDGTEYEPVFVSALGADDLSLVTGGYRLTSGGTRDGIIAFEVLDGAQIQWLKFDPNPFAKGDVYFDAK